MEQSEEKKPEQKKGPILPDGVGLTLEQTKARFAKHHKMILANNEPALMGITLCNAYLVEVEKLHARHKEGLGSLMADKTDAYVSGWLLRLGNSRTAFLSLLWKASAKFLTITPLGSKPSKATQPGRYSI